MIKDNSKVRNISDEKNKSTWLEFFENKTLEGLKATTGQKEKYKRESKNSTKDKGKGLKTTVKVQKIKEKVLKNRYKNTKEKVKTVQKIKGKD